MARGRLGQLNLRAASGQRRKPTRGRAASPQGSAAGIRSARPFNSSSGGSAERERFGIFGKCHDRDSRGAAKHRNRGVRPGVEIISWAGDGVTICSANVDTADTGNERVIRRPPEDGMRVCAPGCAESFRPMKPRNICGPAVARIRRRIGISQEELGRRCKAAGWPVARSVLAKVEIQDRSVSDHELVALSLALRVNVTRLLYARRRARVCLRTFAPKRDDAIAGRYGKPAVAFPSMADVFDRKTRSRVMSSIRGRNTRPELIVRRFLHSRGLRFRIHATGLPGRPDIVLLRLNTVVFVHGCFWHQHSNCRFAVLPKSNRAFWRAKLKRNRLRDFRNASRLRRAGWRVFTIWECGMRERGLERLHRRIMTPLSPAQRRRMRLR